MGFADELQKACSGNVEIVEKESGAIVEVASEPRALADFKRMEDAILSKASEQLESALRWDEIDEEAEGPPDEWLAELGEEAAWKRFRAARGAQMSAKTSPVGLKIATNLFAAVTKSNAIRGSGDRHLNVVMVQVPEPPRSTSRERYEEMALEDEK